MKTKQMLISALIGAIYTALTLLLAPYSFGPVQFRISEALTVLPFLFPFSVWGLFLGCFLSNLIAGVSLLDILFGPLATLLAAFLTARCKKTWLAPLPPVLINALVIGLVLAYVASPANMLQTFPLIAAQIGLGQLAVCYGLGLPLLSLMKKIQPPGN